MQTIKFSKRDTGKAKKKKHYRWVTKITKWWLKQYDSDKYVMDKCFHLKMKDKHKEPDGWALKYENGKLFEILEDKC